MTVSSGLLGALWWLLARVVRFKSAPPRGPALAVDPDKPVIYALQMRQLSALLVLDAATRELGLPRALAPAKGGTSLSERRAYFFLTRHGQPSPLRRDPYRYASMLDRLIGALAADPRLQPQVVPVSIFWGRAPTQQDSVWQALFADNWAVPGFVGQFVRLLMHGRQTLVKFGAPIDLRAALAVGAEPPLDASAGVRRIARMLRAVYRRDREQVIGPDLSHRHTVVNQLIDQPAVRQAIDEQARVKSLPRDVAEQQARKIAVEIASDYSYGFLRLYDRALSALWTRLYGGVELHGFDELVAASADTGLVYLPCHRSHIDYLLLSWLIFHRNLQPPHVAAGVNLKIPLVGALLRRGGAFFLRRSFRGDPLYQTVFAEYLHSVIARGFPIEYFVEGGRSRSGRMLAPKTGLLAMTVASHLRAPLRRLMLVPVWIGYEQLIEGDTFLAELAGQHKRKESLPGLIRALREIRRRRYGTVHVNIGEPIDLDAFLGTHWPAWREHDTDAPRPDVINQLGRSVVTRINDALVVNPINLIALALLAAPKRAMDAAQLAALIDLLRGGLIEQPYSARQIVNGLTGEQAIDYALRQKLVLRVAHPLGDIIRVSDRDWPRLTYFRNNVLHGFALPSLIASVVLRSVEPTATRIKQSVTRMYPFLRTELFLRWNDEQLPDEIDALLDQLITRGLLVRIGDAIVAPPMSSAKFGLLNAVAQLVREPIERYLIVIATLVALGSERVEQARLVDACELVGQRVAWLHEQGAPEFADRGSFQAIITALLGEGLLEVRGALLCFEQGLIDAAAEAERMLPEDARIAIAHAALLGGEADGRRAVQE